MRGEGLECSQSKSSTAYTAAGDAKGAERLFLPAKLLQHFIRVFPGEITVRPQDLVFLAQYFVQL